MKKTSTSLQILSLLENCHCHFSAAEIYEQLRPQLPAVAPSTVYRILERLVHTGQVSISDMGGGTEVYEIANHRHHHLVCERCHTVLTLSDAEIQPLFESLQERHSFVISTNHLVLFGICEKCRSGS